MISSVIIKAHNVLTQVQIYIPQFLKNMFGVNCFLKLRFSRAHEVIEFISAFTLLQLTACRLVLSNRTCMGKFKFEACDQKNKQYLSAGFQNRQS